MSRLFAVLFIVLAAACSEEGATGPVDIVWDRDMCELCKMVISDARFVAQVRGGPKRKVYKFDDLGCAVNWLNGQTWAGESATEIWVAERRSTREAVIWLDARSANYVSEPLTPMGYGFGAQVEPVPGAVTFEQMTSRILANVPNHICAKH